jgi:carboxyl-terminal processing protease
MKGLVLDLRFNPGGSLSEAIKVSSFFLKDGVVVSVKDKAGNEQVYNREGKYLGDFPLVVLINGGSASASEIVAGAIKDRERGVLVGEKSYGKGSVQNLIPLPSGAGIKITMALYYTPSGISIHHIGITPDTVVPETDGFLFFDGFITNVDETIKKDQQKDLIEKSTLTNEEKDKLKNKEDTQLKTAEGILKGIILYKK